jgi:hypothetical protein
MSEIPHGPWFIRAKPRSDGQAIIENGTAEGSLIAVCEWHIAEFIVRLANAEFEHQDGTRPPPGHPIIRAPDTRKSFP